MTILKLINNLKLINTLIISTSIMSCSTNSINTTTLDSNQIIKNEKINNSRNFKSNNNLKFKVKFSSNFNPEAYYLAWGDIRQAIKNKTIPDVVHHYIYSQTTEPQRITDSNYLQIKQRIESKEWSEEAYLIANPDIKAAIDAGTEQTGYQHWYNYAINNEPSRTTSQAYLDAKSATDLGFSEKAYRLAHTDIDNAIKSGALASAYNHWNSYAKINEPSRLSDPRYIEIKKALDYGFDEEAYRFAYSDVDNSIKNGTLQSGLFHYINYGVNENRLERLIYQQVKLYLLNSNSVNYFNPEAYYLAWSDVRQEIKNNTIPDAVYHYTYIKTTDPYRFTDSNYLQIKQRIESKEWSEEAYLIANPDIKAAIDAGTEQTGYQHWYNYAINNEPSRTTSQAYLDAKSATDLGFSEKAYRLAHTDIDNAIKSGALASAYNHWNSYAKINEPSRLSDPRYIEIKKALDYGFDEKAYRLAYPSVDGEIKIGSLPSALFHYINYGVNEDKLESFAYQEAKLAVLNGFDEKAYRLAYPSVDSAIKSGSLTSALSHYINFGINENKLQTPEYIGAQLALSLDFDETRYRLAFPDVTASINAGILVSGFHHFYNYGKNEGRLTRQVYLDTKNKVIIGGTRE